MKPGTPPPGPIEVLVVDDSAVSRQALRAILEEDPAVRVRTAGDPYEAVAIMGRFAPTVVVLDVEMPRMDGLTFLRKLMRQHPLPVLLCTDHPARGLAGLELGARGVIAKPRWDDPADRESWGARLRDLLREAAGRPGDSAEPRPRAEPRHDADAILPRSAPSRAGAPKARIIAIGASTGGVQAIPRLLADLPSDAPGVVVVQHMPERFTAAFAERLDRDPAIPFRVVEAADDEPIVPGTVVVVPGHAHGMVVRSGDGYRVSLADGPPVSRHRPSVDVLFRSTAMAAGASAAGVLLTGMGDDGARGLVELREAGALTVAQDEPTCVVFGMPREAIRLGGAGHVLPLHRIGAALGAWATRPTASP